MSAKQQDGSRARAHAPVQARSQKRIDAAMTAAEKLLVEIGPERTSVPEIANAAGVPRPTIYQYFPDKYALFAHLADGHFERVLTYIADALSREEARGWREVVTAAVKAATDYYNANAVARILLLTGPYGIRDREAQAEKDRALSKLLRERFSQDSSLGKLPDDPDVVALAIEMAFACLKYGYFQDGAISAGICAEATRAAVRYLSSWE